MKQSGLLLVNKPSGPTSYDMIRWIKKNLKGVKIGHCGTLDPMASGLLIILLGHATKKQSIYMNQFKTYLFQIRLGIQTDSGDITGKVIREEVVPELNREMVQATLESFLGDQEQLPPMFSAIKHKGKPLYKLARQGITVERKPRKVHIKSINCEKILSASELEIKILCSSGTYVRTLAEDIGAKLNTCATVTRLVRESIGDFSIEQAIPGSQLHDMNEAQIWGNCL